jgi:PiT family inorganic phosphate transporter
VAAGVGAVDWANIGRISLAWVVTPMVSGIDGSRILQHNEVLNSRSTQPNRAAARVDSLAECNAFSVFGVIVLPTLFDRPFFAALPIPAHDLPIATGTIAAVALTFISWRQLARAGLQEYRLPKSLPGKSVHL